MAPTGYGTKVKCVWCGKEGWSSDFIDVSGLLSMSKFVCSERCKKEYKKSKK